MTILQKIKFKLNETSTESKVFWVLSFVFLMIGIISGAIAMVTVRNYFEPYKLLLVIGIFSLVIGMRSAKYIKPFLKLNRKQAENFFGAYLYLSSGFFGVFLFIGNKINVNVLSDEICNNYRIVDKQHIERHGRNSVDESILYLDFGNKIEKMQVNYSYWKYVEIGNKISVCKHNSKIGFDFLTIEGEE